MLRVASGAAPEVVRAAYRELIRDRHPDRAGERATGDAARINEAYAVLRETVGPPVVDEVAPSPFRSDAGTKSVIADTVTLLDDDTVAFSFPAEEVFHLLVDVAHEVGDVTYVDPEAGLLEVLVQFEGEPLCSIVLSLQGRADRVEAFCSIEALDGSEAPPVADVVSLLVENLRARLRSR